MTRQIINQVIIFLSFICLLLDAEIGVLGVFGVLGVLGVLQTLGHCSPDNLGVLGVTGEPVVFLAELAFSSMPNFFLGVLNPNTDAPLTIFSSPSSNSAEKNSHVRKYS